MKRRIFWSIFLVAFLTLAVSISVSTVIFYHEFQSERKEEIKVDTCYIISFYDKVGISCFDEINVNTEQRITLISGDGSILYDSHVDSKELDNHADRPEVIDALQNGIGESERRSSTFSESTYYYAVKLDDGNVLRVSITIRSITRIIDDTANYIVVIVIFTLVIVLLTAHLLTKRIILPLNEIDIKDPLSSNTYDELSPLIQRIAKQNERIALQISELTATQQEFSEITNGMSEAVIVFSQERKVLSANLSAKRLFALSETISGTDHIELCSNVEFIHAAEAAFLGERSEAKLSKDGHIYRLIFNPVSRATGFAAVLFASDITAAEKSEQMRREFSANVSHELKTPLTSIMGYAEIMQSGIARIEDHPRFTKQIYNEAKRLLSLINDIIKLSSLDEDGLRHEFTDVDLYVIAENVIAQLRSKAKAYEVTLKIQGTHYFIKGISNTLYEMIFNLCDNAITYNIVGGSVTISLWEQNSHILFAVEDTGIGIAPEHHGRIFERFYRVDKSHSRDTGGTGLGLSIVKHAALLHGAEISLNSKLGGGTCVTINFLKQPDAD